MRILIKLIDKIIKKPKKNVSIFSESPLKTSFYEELQKNEWCNVIDDKPDELMAYININKRRKKVK